jgi:hypothetical protein
MGSLPGPEPANHLEAHVMAGREVGDLVVLDMQDAVRPDAVGHVRRVALVLERDLERIEPLSEHRAPAADAAETLHARRAEAFHRRDPGRVCQPPLVGHPLADIVVEQEPRAHPRLNGAQLEFCRHDHTASAKSAQHRVVEIARFGTRTPSQAGVSRDHLERGHVRGERAITVTARTHAADRQQAADREIEQIREHPRQQTVLERHGDDIPQPRARLAPDRLALAVHAADPAHLGDVDHQRVERERLAARAVAQSAQCEPRARRDRSPYGCLHLVGRSRTHDSHRRATQDVPEILA